MSKKLQEKKRRLGTPTRERIYFNYINKYFNMFMSRYEWTGDISEEAEYFIMKEFWDKGRIAAFNSKAGDILAFAPFAEETYNLYDYPVLANLINTRGSSLVPVGAQRVDKDIVLGYAQKNHKSVYEMIEFFILRIVDVEMTINTNLKASKTPWIVATSGEDTTTIKNMYNDLMNDEDTLFVNFNEPEKARALVSGAPYIIDKLYAYKQALENEILTYLGVDNLGAQEKKEHLITTEVEVNNDIISQCNDAFLEMFQDFCKKIETVLGHHIEVKSKAEDKSEDMEKTVEEEEQE